MTSSLMRRSFHYLGRSSGRPFVYRPPHLAQSGLDRCVVRLLLRWHQRSPTVGHHMKRGKRDHNRRNNFWHISLTAAVAALVVHNAINGGPAKARGHVLLSAFTHSP